MYRVIMPLRNLKQKEKLPSLGVYRRIVSKRVPNDGQMVLFKSYLLTFCKLVLLFHEPIA